MADELDIASEVSEMFLNKALQEHKSKVSRVSTKFCIDCDIEIPEQRRKFVIGVKRCIDCQEIFELENRK